MFDEIFHNNYSYYKCSEYFLEGDNDSTSITNIDIAEAKLQDYKDWRCIKLGFKIDKKEYILNHNELIELLQKRLGFLETLHKEAFEKPFSYKGFNLLDFTDYDFVFANTNLHQKTLIFTGLNTTTNIFCSKKIDKNFNIFSLHSSEGDYVFSNGEIFLKNKDLKCNTITFYNSKFSDEERPQINGKKLDKNIIAKLSENFVTNYMNPKVLLNITETSSNNINQIEFSSGLRNHITSQPLSLYDLPPDPFVDNEKRDYSLFKKASYYEQIEYYQSSLSDVKKLLSKYFETGYSSIHPAPKVFYREIEQYQSNLDRIKNTIEGEISGIVSFLRS